MYKLILIYTDLYFLLYSYTFYYREIVNAPAGHGRPSCGISVSGDKI